MRTCETPSLPPCRRCGATAYAHGAAWRIPAGLTGPPPGSPRRRGRTSELLLIYDIKVAGIVPYLPGTRNHRTESVRTNHFRQVESDGARVRNPETMPAFPAARSGHPVAVPPVRTVPSAA